MRGRFFVLEGLDRSGKSTQCARLVEHLQRQGRKAELLRFPDRTTPMGKMIDSYLTSQTDMNDQAIHLLFSANRWEKAASIRQKLRDSIDIVCDRYAFSGIAFSVAKGLDYQWCKAPDVGLPAPDQVLFLDISPEHAEQRGGYGQERYEKREMQLKVREVFGRIRDDMTSAQGKWSVVDAGQSLEAVSLQIQHIADQVLIVDDDATDRSALFS
ncbi:uncharacterized protein L969DRAFT_86208 [Mixia osmundae IAM 14324]|uniref:Thymidylate kinase n=1 Tax=Mixia osmundae (strain CBS 9802 / IAM 14324 / JCM 22182 / KY 12970) TaxID=764103 RepID=G7DU40_MIXOS|nr:uncharacterized protein L969DRAFT_86208 [Mixia osmundae IAM 14324]KEI40967.1 hypothetical protein L969DRAFT_86208 [Mixia osmundae IAM 14324]GAA94100.1 hypothetical protein E5Q_00747 [Mixia osmundae IAM 14324]